jgi:ATP-dependent RNA helicase DeaD
MPELEEAGERATGQVARTQNVVYTLPYATESIAEFLTPALARVDPAAGGTQVIVVTRDAETALTISETVLRLAGPASIEVVPVTSASRAGRIFRSRPVLAVAGTPTELQALVRASILKLDTVRTVVIAWADDIIGEEQSAVTALEGLLGELPDANRVIVTRKMSPAVENLIERYARRARRVGAPESEVPQLPADYEMPIVRYVTVGGTARGSALRKLLDDLDPPSAVIVARDAAAADQATAVLRTLGYREDDKTINVTRGDIGSAAVHTVIFVQPPVLPAELQRVAQAKPVQIVAIAAPGEVPWLRELTSGRLSPLNFQGPERRARDREEALREELRAVLARGVPAREVISLEPLLQEFDGAELAAAALNLLERERAQRRAAEVNQPAVARPRPDGDRSRPASSGAMTRLFMTVGTRDGVKVGDLMGSIAGEGGIPGDHVGKIDLRESHALVEVSAEDAASVIARLNGASIKGRRVVVRAERDRDERERAAGPRGRPGRDSGGDRPPRRGPSDRPRAGGSSDRPRSGSRPPRKDRDRS